MLAQHLRTMVNKAVPIFQQAVNKNPQLYIEACAQVAAAMYAMREVIVQFHLRPGNISYFPSGQTNRKADKEGGRRNRVRKV